MQKVLRLIIVNSINQWMSAYCLSFIKISNSYQLTNWLSFWNFCCWLLGGVVIQLTILCLRTTIRTYGLRRNWLWKYNLSKNIFWIKMYANKHADICIYACTIVHTICIYASMYDLYVWMYVCTYVWNVCIHACMMVCMYVCMFDMYVHMYVLYISMYACNWICIASLKPSQVLNSPLHHYCGYIQDKLFPP